MPDRDLPQREHLARQHNAEGTLAGRSPAGAANFPTGPPLAPLPRYLGFGAPFQAVFGPSRTTQAELIRDRKIRSVLVGSDTRGRRMIETESYLEYLQKQRVKEERGEIGAAAPAPHLRRAQKKRRANAAAAREAKAASPSPALAERSTAAPRRSPGGGRRT